MATRPKLSKNERMMQVRFIVIIVAITFVLMSAAVTIYHNERQKFFLEEYTELNNAYSLVLDATSKPSKDTPVIMQNYTYKWSEFYSRFYDEAPYTNDNQWSSSLYDINTGVWTAAQSVNDHNYAAAYVQLVHIGQSWDDLLVKYNISVNKTN